MCRFAILVGIYQCVGAKGFTVYHQPEHKPARRNPTQLDKTVEILPLGLAALPQ